MYIHICMKRSTFLQHLQSENWILKNQLVKLQQEYDDIQSEYKGFRIAVEMADCSTPRKHINRRAKKKDIQPGTVYYVHEYNSTNRNIDISSCYSSLTHSD